MSRELAPSPKTPASRRKSTSPADLTVFSDTKDAERYVNLMKSLEREIPVWPPIDELLSSGQKLRTIQDLDSIAVRLQYGRPRTMRVERPEQVIEGWVLKRERSECMRHVIVPGITTKKQRKEAGVFSANGSTWIQQEFAPLLILLGEWRAIFVHQQHKATLHTEVKSQCVWEWDVQQDRWSLSELRCEEPSTSAKIH
jgi:hypothetical protein